MTTPWTDLHAQVHQVLRDRQLLPRSQRVLVAVSGGQDSMCLAQLLLDLQPKWDWHLAIAHGNHGWREDAAANADFVQDWAERQGLPVYRFTADQPLPSEAAARTWRYEHLARLAGQHHNAIVCTGHTASDRAETLLYNLVRGSGLEGLQALAWQRSLAPTRPDLQVVRPLLGLTRTQTGHFCQTRALPVWIDATNTDCRYARNRIRHHLLPDLATHFNPQAESALAQTAEILQADVDFLEQAAAQLWAKVHLNTASPYLRLYRPPLQTAPLAIQRRVIRRFLQASLAITPTFAQVEKVVALITAPQQSQTDSFPGGAWVRVQGEDLVWVLPPHAP